MKNASQMNKALTFSSRVNLFFHCLRAAAITIHAFRKRLRK
ncbi:hypothetical protein CLV42_114110 [Chitinophaga ginsengisoli]|uniref:Uncharacterized protein n=1 Tax=Chitinophaga ginsengisoli TaxID=363837 RepID=A0A2P8FTD1_9BACT|nr:hypothetical protein CLV42_114110 [Chitinophaga ginsengisoli]